MKKIIRYLPLTSIYIGIAYLSLKHPSGKPSPIPNLDKIEHFIAYFTLSAVISLTFKNRILKNGFLLFSLVFGISMEFIQGQLSYRDMSLEDGLANTIGIIMGTIIIKLWRKRNE